MHINVSFSVIRTLLLQANVSYRFPSMIWHSFIFPSGLVCVIWVNRKFSENFIFDFRKRILFFFFIRHLFQYRVLVDYKIPSGWLSLKSNTNILLFLCQNSVSGPFLINVLINRTIYILHYRVLRLYFFIYKIGSNNVYLGHQ